MHLIRIITNYSQVITQGEAELLCTCTVILKVHENT